jgi:hypothetical protein
MEKFINSYLEYSEYENVFLKSFFLFPSALSILFFFSKWPNLGGGGVADAWLAHLMYFLPFGICQILSQVLY